MTPKFKKLTARFSQIMEECDQKFPAISLKKCNEFTLSDLRPIHEWHQTISKFEYFTLIAREFDSFIKRPLISFR